MTDNVSVSGPVEIQSDSHSRVAFELMKHISSWENAQDAEKHTRDYWLKLYVQCNGATRGLPLARILER